MAPVFDDLKFLLIFGFIPLAFLAYSSNFDMRPSKYDRPWRTPTVDIVPAGTPGAMSMDEFSHWHYDSHSDVWVRNNLP